MIPVHAMFASAANPSFNAVFFENGWDYVIVSLIAAWVLMYLAIPVAAWLFAGLLRKFGSLLNACWRGLAIAVDLLFVVLIRSFRLKRLPPALDFGAPVQKGGEDATTSRWEGYRRVRRPITIVLMLLLIVLITFSDMYKWHEKNDTIRAAYAAVIQTFRGADGVNGEPDAADAQAGTDDGERQDEEVYVVLNERGKEGGNLRADGSLTAAEVGVVMPGDVLLYLDEKSDGTRIWYKVRTPGGQEGWISSVISTKVHSPDGQPASP